MLGRLVRGFAYVRAPVKTFAALHPLKFMKYGAMLWAGKKIWDMAGGRLRRRGRFDDARSLSGGR